jgi:hypothetical protein
VLLSPIPAVLETAVPDTASQTNGAERGASEQNPARASETTNLCSAPVEPLSSSLKPSRNTAYLYPEDLTKLRQLGGYASTERGIRANDSMMSELRFLIRDGCPISIRFRRRRSVGSKANQPTDLIIRKESCQRMVRTIHA